MDYFIFLILEKNPIKIPTILKPLCNDILYSNNHYIVIKKLCSNLGQL